MTSPFYLFVFQIFSRIFVQFLGIFLEFAQNFFSNFLFFFSNFLETYTLYIVLFQDTVSAMIKPDYTKILGPRIKGVCTFYDVYRCCVKTRFFNFPKIKKNGGSILNTKSKVASERLNAQVGENFGFTRNLCEKNIGSHIRRRPLSLLTKSNLVRHNKIISIITKNTRIYKKKYLDMS